MEIAKDKGISAAQFALAWLLHQKPFIVPIPGVSRMETMEDNVKAAEVKFTGEELNEIGELLSGIEIAGERYDPNSENGQSVRK